MKKNMSKRTNAISLVAGGELDARHLADIRSADVVIGVDRGALWLITHGVNPDIAIGDFDSITLKEKRIVHNRSGRYMEYLPNKDETDLELAIREAIVLKPGHVTIYGVLGRRFDHALSAIHLLSKLESHNIYGEIVDNFNKINIVRRLVTIPKDDMYPYLSVIPLGKTARVTLRGFLYPVSNMKFSRDVSLGISNQISDKSARIVVHAGEILVVRSSDVHVRSHIS